MADEPIQLYSIPRVAKYLDCSRAHVYRLIAVGKLRAVETKALGTRPKTRVRRDDLNAFIQAQTRPALARELPVPFSSTKGGVEPGLGWPT